MLSVLPLALTNPLVLLAGLVLPLIWLLLRITPPKPRREPFPPFRILARLIDREKTPVRTPWWLVLLRLVLCCALIAALAGPVWKPDRQLSSGQGALLMVIDNGWASGGVWDQQMATAERLLGEAEAANRSVRLILGASQLLPDAGLISAVEAGKMLQSHGNLSTRPDHLATANAVESATARLKPSSLFWLSDGLVRAGTKQLATAIANAGASEIGVLRPDASKILAIDALTNDPEAMTGRLVRAVAAQSVPVTISGLDGQGRVIATATITFATDETTASFRFTEPVELRNEIARVVIEEARNAGAVRLLDDSNRRRLIGLVTGKARDLAQPLLSPLYYIQRALQPYSDLRPAGQANLSIAIPELIGQNISVMVLADIGTLPEAPLGLLSAWVEKGGTLIRFAGPRLASATDSKLLPVKLRHGDRALGGALSWDRPKPVAPFERHSPFFGLAAPHEISVNRQVLALQEIDLDTKTWARLEDGTPLVTATRYGTGQIVLFHVGSDASWSNLPLSGTFVEMLRRIVSQSRSSGVPQTVADEPLRLPPIEVLDGAGRLTAPGSNISPLTIQAGRQPKISRDNPPGFYGTADGHVALNLFSGPVRLVTLDDDMLPGGARLEAYAQSGSLNLAPWLLALAALLLALDCLIVLWMAGALARRSALGTIFAAWLAAGIWCMPQPTFAQHADIDFSATLKTRIAYVASGVREVDETTLAGLRGLTEFIAVRTALEPGPPVEVDLGSDELVFYSLIYWPMHGDAAIPDAAAMARVDAFMKQGGTVLFDTRDQASGSLVGVAASEEARRLQTILSTLDIPTLEPAPADHVLTKAFYLLDTFPGRYAGGDLWVEALPDVAGDGQRPARAGDGVSSIIITSNDFAGAWAVDENFRPLYPTLPPDPFQREMAFRVGVNLMMYALTGNYKADQVHIPALLERLGQ